MIVVRIYRHYAGPGGPGAVDNSGKSIDRVLEREIEIDTSHRNAMPLGALVEALVNAANEYVRVQRGKP